jgi:UDP-glucose 4-epimerase
MEIMVTKKVLITGGLGNLGSWLTTHFASKDYQVTVLAKTRRPILLDIPFEFMQCDLTDESTLNKTINGAYFDLVIHAGSVNDGFVADYAKLALEVNAWGTRNLLEALKGNPPGHFIYFSTFQVYGKYAGAISEETPLETKNDYGLSHLFAEGYVKQYGFTSKIPFTIIRLTNSYGAPKDPDSSKWYLILNDLSKSAFLKKEIRLSSNGQAPRDFIWMGDVCKVIEKLENHGPTNQTYNLSGQLTYRMIDIAGFVQQAYHQFFGEELPIIVNDQDQSTFPDGFYVSSAKLRAKIPFYTQNHFVSEAIQIFNLLKSIK